MYVQIYFSVFDVYTNKLKIHIFFISFILKFQFYIDKVYIQKNTSDSLHILHCSVFTLFVTLHIVLDQGSQTKVSRNPGIRIRQSLFLITYHSLHLQHGFDLFGRQSK